MAKKNVISYDVEITSNAESLFGKMTKAASKTGKELEADLTEALNHAQQNLKNFAEMQKKVLAGSSDITKPMYDQARKVAKASAEFMRVYNNNQANANRVTEQLTEPYKALEEELQKVYKLRTEYENKRADSKKNIGYVRDVEEYQRNAKAIEAVMAKEQEYQKFIEWTNKSLESRKRKLMENNDKYNEWQAAHINDENAENPYKWMDVALDRYVISFDKAIKTTEQKIAELRAPYEGLIDRYEKALDMLGVQGLKPTTDLVEKEVLAIFEQNQAMDASVQRIHELTQAQEDLANTGGKFEYVGIAQDAEARIKDLATDMTALMQSAQSADTPTKQIAENSKNIAKHTGIAKTLMCSFANAVKRAQTHHRGLHRSSNGFFADTKQGFRHALRNIMRYGLGVRSLYFLFRRLRSATKEAFKVMAQQIPEVNQQVSSLVTNFNLMKANLATMVQPLLKWVVPAFERMAHAAQRAMEWVAKLFATITGQQYIYRASSAWVDYADSVNGAAKAVNNLLGIDELNVLNDSSGSSGSGTFGPENISYELVKFNDSIFQKLKEAWENADFTEIGQMLYAKLGDVFKSINDKIPAMEEYCKRVAKSFGTLINGYVDDYGDAPRLAGTIANLFNVAFNTLGTFADTVEWSKVGEFLRKGIEDFITNFRWEDAGFSVAKLCNGIVKSVYNLIGDGETWRLLGYKIAAGINTFSNHFDWETFGKTLWSFIHGFVKGITTALNTIEWYSIGQKVGDFLKSIDWFQCIKDLGNLGDAIVQAVLDTLEGLDFLGIVRELRGPDSAQSKRQRELEIQKITGEIDEETYKALTKENQSPFARWLQEKFSGIRESQEAKYAIEEADGLGEMIKKGFMAPFMSETFISDWKQIWTKMFGNGKSDYGVAGEVGEINSPSKKFLRIGNYIVEGFLTPFSGLKSSFTKIWEGVVNSAKSPLNQLIDMLNRFLQALQTVQNATSDMFSSIGSGLTSLGGTNVNITRWTAPKIPYLAQGAVIPPNNQFLAMLGDQKQGTNIEAPLSTIQEAVANVLEPYLKQIMDNTQILADKDYATYIGDREIAMANSRGTKQLGLSLIK